MMGSGGDMSDKHSIRATNFRAKSIVASKMMQQQQDPSAEGGTPSNIDFLVINQESDISQVV
jgi:hypothetical protein